MKAIHAATPSFLAALEYVLPAQYSYQPHHYPMLQFRRNLAAYPPEWSMGEITHQHFLAHAFLGLWHVEVRGRMGWHIQVCWPQTAFSSFLPEPLDICLDKMCLGFQVCL